MAATGRWRHHAASFQSANINHRPMMVRLIVPPCGEQHRRQMKYPLELPVAFQQVLNASARTGHLDRPNIGLASVNAEQFDR
jgi:hypothetical protein